MNNPRIADFREELKKESLNDDEIAKSTRFKELEV